MKEKEPEVKQLAPGFQEGEKVIAFADVKKHLGSLGLG